MANQATCSIALITDFGIGSPYVGQMRMVLADRCKEPQPSIVDLIADLPPFRPDLAAYLLPALIKGFTPNWLCLCVVDPGVGGSRRPIILNVDGQWFIGPDNGLLAVIAKRANKAYCWQIPQQEAISATFHGRDLFAPQAARIANGNTPDWEQLDVGSLTGIDWPDELHKIVYVDHYGNMMTGVSASAIADQSEIILAGQRLKRARTFSDVRPGEAFWYQNAFGLVEIAVNQGNASQALGVGVGSSVAL